MLLLTVYSVLLLPKPTLSPTFGHMVSPPPLPSLPTDPHAPTKCIHP